MTATQKTDSEQTVKQHYLQALRDGDRVVASALAGADQALKHLNLVHAVRERLAFIRTNTSIEEAERQTCAAKAKLERYREAMAEAKTKEQSLIAEVDEAWSKVGCMNSALTTVIRTCLVNRPVYDALRHEIDDAGIEVSNEKIEELSKPLVEP